MSNRASTPPFARSAPLWRTIPNNPDICRPKSEGYRFLPDTTEDVGTQTNLAEVFSVTAEEFGQH
jgi:hypothetical protein